MFIRSVCQTAMLLVLACSTANASVVSTYTDRSAWEAALVGSVFDEEGFAGDARAFASNSELNVVGDLSIDMVGTVDTSDRLGLTGSGFFEGEVDSSSFTDGDGLNIRFHHAAAMGIGLLGLQNDELDLPADLNLSEIGLLFGGDSFLVNDILDGTNTKDQSRQVSGRKSTGLIPFIGFVFDAPLESFMFVHGDQVARNGVAWESEEFYLDGVVVASQRAGLVRQYSVPEPGSLILLLSGFAVLFVNKRMRRVL